MVACLEYDSSVVYVGYEYGFLGTWVTNVWMGWMGRSISTAFCWLVWGIHDEVYAMFCFVLLIFTLLFSRALFSRQRYLPGPMDENDCLGCVSYYKELRCQSWGVYFQGNWVLRWLGPICQGPSTQDVFNGEKSPALSAPILLLFREVVLEMLHLQLPRHP